MFNCFLGIYRATYNGVETCFALSEAPRHVVDILFNCFFLFHFFVRVSFIMSYRGFLTPGINDRSGPCLKINPLNLHYIGCLSNTIE